MTGMLSHRMLWDDQNEFFSSPCDVLSHPPIPFMQLPYLPSESSSACTPSDEFVVLLFLRLPLAVRSSSDSDFKHRNESPCSHSHSSSLFLCRILSFGSPSTSNLNLFVCDMCVCVLRSLTCERSFVGVREVEGKWTATGTASPLQGRRERHGKQVPIPTAGICGCDRVYSFSLPPCLSLSVCPFLFTTSFT